MMRPGAAAPNAMEQSETKQERPLRLLLLADTHCTGHGHSLLSRAHFEDYTYRVLHPFRIDRGIRPGRLYKTSRETLDRMDLLFARHADRVDHILIAGDVTDAGGARQYQAVRELLDAFSPDKIALAPGNHDVGPYLDPLNRGLQNRAFVEAFADFLDKNGRADDPPFPFTKQIRSDCALIGLDSNDSPTNLHFHGRLSNPQLARFEAALDAASAVPHTIVILHHDPAVPSFWHYDFMENRNRFLEVLGQHARRGDRRSLTVINGHTHRAHILTDMVPDVTFVSVPMFAKKQRPDHLLIQVDDQGQVSELKPGGKSRT